MPKPKKKKRALVATDTMWDLVNNAADKAEMSNNEWVLSAISQALKTGVHGEGGIDIEEAAEFALANVMERGGASIYQLLTKLDSTKTLCRDMIRALALVHQIRIDEQEGKPMRVEVYEPDEHGRNKRKWIHPVVTREEDRKKIDLSDEDYQKFYKTAKSHGTSMASLNDKLIADFLAKPKRE